MLVVDSSAWIEWLTDSALAAKIADLMPDREQIIVPTLVQLELIKWLRRERCEEAADELLAMSQMCRVVPLTTLIAVEAADLCRVHKLSTADAIILATAYHAGAGLLTCDRHFEGLPGVMFLSKNAPAS